MKIERQKRLIYFILLIVGVALIAYPINFALLGSTADKLPFSLLGVYSFFAISALMIYLSLEFLSGYLGDKIAYLFLFTVMIKLGVFLVIYFGKNSSSVITPLSGKLSMIFALFVFLAIEGFATYKVLISSHSDEKKN